MAMTRQEHLLLKAAEECCEVAKEIHKALSFGLDDHYPEHPMKNRDRIASEVCDLVAVLEMLEEEKILVLGMDDTWDQSIRDKKAKVEKWLKYSKQVGTLAEPPPTELP